MSSLLCVASQFSSQDVIYTSVFQGIQHGKPVFGTFIITYFDCENLFLSFKIQAKNNVGYYLADNPVVAYMDIIF